MNMTDPSISSKTSKSESTSTSSGCTPTFVDSAGCPNVNNTTYTTSTPSMEFRIACAIDLTSSPGEDIELANVTTQTLDNCLDSCARYNNGQCQAATWIQFSPDSPEMNSKCFFKANSGVRIPMNSTGTIATSGFRISWHGLMVWVFVLAIAFHHMTWYLEISEHQAYCPLLVTIIFMGLAFGRWVLIIYTVFKDVLQRGLWGYAGRGVHSFTRHEDMMFKICIACG